MIPVKPIQTNETHETPKLPVSNTMTPLSYETKLTCETQEISETMTQMKQVILTMKLTKPVKPGHL